MDTEFDFEEYTDEELTKEWNRLETCKLSYYVEKKMDAIEKFLFDERGVIAWNQEGEITVRDERG
jgi:hypothetical protein